MYEPTRGPPSPTEKSVKFLARVLGYEKALHALIQAIDRDEPWIKVVLCETERLRVSLIFKYTPPLLQEDDIRLIGVCFEGLGDIPESLRNKPVEDIVYYRGGLGIWVLVLDEPRMEKALELAREFCSFDQPVRFETGFELNEVC